MIDLEGLFEDYDKYLVENISLEIRINNCKIVIFYDIKEADRYINTIYREYNNFRWFVLQRDHVFVFDLYNEEVCND